MFLDENDGFKKALGSGKLGLHGLLYPSVWKNAERAKQKYPEMQSDLNVITKQASDAASYEQSLTSYNRLALPPRP